MSVSPATFSVGKIMTEFAEGGYVSGKPLPPEYLKLHPDECVYNIDLKCIRPEHDERHREKND